MLIGRFNALELAEYDLGKEYRCEKKQFVFTFTSQEDALGCFSYVKNPEEYNKSQIYPKIKIFLQRSSK
jgi:hypothetical protein